MTPMSEPDDRPASRAARVTEWIRAHRWATGIGVVVAGLSGSHLPQDA